MELLRMAELDFENDVRIDKHALDEEWDRQPELAWIYTTEESDAQKDVDDLKVEVDEADAELKSKFYEIYLDVKENPKEYDVEKPTDTTANAIAYNHEDVVEARQNLFMKMRERNDAQNNLGRIHAGVQAITIDRRQAIQTQYDMWVKGYFGTVRPSSGGESMDSEKERANQAIKFRKKKKGE